MKKRIAIVDYGAGNLGSVANAIVKLGYEPNVTGKPSEVLGASAVILPGVGAAGDAMDNLKAIGMADVIRQLIDAKRPLFAVCVGLAVKSAVGGCLRSGCNCRAQPGAIKSNSKTSKRDLCTDCILALICLNLNSLLSRYEFAILFS